MAVRDCSQMLYIRILLAAAALLVIAAAHADVYRWVDPQGHVHYGDQPRQAGQAPMPIQSTPRPDPDLEQRRQRRDRLLRIFSEDRDREQAEERERRARKAEQLRKCRRARSALEELERGGAFYQLRDNGERQYLDAKEIERRKTHWRAAIEQSCAMR